MTAPLLHARDVPEWIGKTLNDPVPERVRLRVYLRDRGRCQICTRVLRPGERTVCDHREAIINGGENRERNLQTICDWCDRKAKTPADVAEKSKVAAVRSKHILGRKAKGRPMPGTKASGMSKGFDGKVRFLGSRTGGT